MGLRAQGRLASSGRHRHGTYSNRPERNAAVQRVTAYQHGWRSDRPVRCQPAQPRLFGPAAGWRLLQLASGGTACPLARVDTRFPLPHRRPPHGDMVALILAPDYASAGGASLGRWLDRALATSPIGDGGCHEERRHVHRWVARWEGKRVSTSERAGRCRRWPARSNRHPATRARQPGLGSAGSDGTVGAPSVLISGNTLYGCVFVGLWSRSRVGGLPLLANATLGRESHPC